MSKTLPEWGSISFDIPEKMVFKTKKGKIIEAKTLTKNKNIATRNKIKSINLISSNTIDIKSKVEEKDKPLTKNKIKQKVEEKDEPYIIPPIEPLPEIKNEDNSSSKIKLTNKQKECISNIENIHSYLESGRKTMFKTDKQIKYFNDLNSAIIGFDYYPTPLEYSRLISNEIKKWGDEPISILDACCGLANLSIEYIKDGLLNNQTVYMNDFNQTWISNITDLESKNIIIDWGNFLQSYENYYNKNIHVILCNPPFSVSFEIKGKLYNDYKLGYFFFLYSCLKIMENNRGIKDLFFICPKTHFKVHSEGTGGTEIDMPRATIKLIKDYFKDENDIDEIFDYNCGFICDVKGFKTIRKGKPTDLNMTFGLYQFYLNSY